MMSISTLLYITFILTVLSVIHVFIKLQEYVTVIVFLIFEPVGSITCHILQALWFDLTEPRMDIY